MDSGRAAIVCIPGLRVFFRNLQVPSAGLLLRNLTKVTIIGYTPRPPDVALLLALWFQLDGIWDLLKGSRGVLVYQIIWFPDYGNLNAVP